MYPFRRRFLGQDLWNDSAYTGNMMGQNYGEYNFENPLEDEDPYDQLTKQYEQNKIRTMPDSQPTDFASVYREMMNRQDGPSMTAYRKFVQAGAPKEEDYKPTKMGRLGAMLSGMGAAYNNPAVGMEMVERQLQRPYRKALEKHERQGGYLKESANLENASVSKQLSILNSMREMENQRRDNERADEQFALSVRTANLNMQKTLLEISNYGKRYQIDKTDGHLYMIDELNPQAKRVDMGKFDLNTGERIDESSRTARANAEATDPILYNRSKALQDSGFQNSLELQRRSQEHSDSNVRQSPTQKEIINQTAIEALVRTDPNKYKTVYIAPKSTDGVYEINNPLKDRGVKIVNGVATDAKGVPLSTEEIKQYNAFVEIHNLKIKGIDEEKSLTKLPNPADPAERYKKKPKQQSSLRYGESPFFTPTQNEMGRPGPYRY